MQTEDAYSSGHLVLSHFGTCMCSNIETNFSWTCLVSRTFEFRTSLGTSVLLPKCKIEAVLKSPLLHNFSYKKIKDQFFILKITRFCNYTDYPRSFYRQRWLGEFICFSAKFNFLPPFKTFQWIKLAVSSTWPEILNIDSVVPWPCKPSFTNYICKWCIYWRYLVFLKQNLNGLKWETDLNLIRK